jgi:hypothetical protein
MTAQAPERIIIDDRSRELYAQPLYRLLASRRMSDLFEDGDGWSTACWRRYRGTWEIVGGRLHLVHLNVMWPDERPLPLELRARLLRAVPCQDFPIPADWFNGRLRIPIGRRLVYSHHGWSHWFERERVIAFKHGVVTRDREVDTRAMLERRLARDPDMRSFLDGTEVREPGPLVWFDDSDEDWDADWWPPDYVRPAIGSQPLQLDRGG